MYHCIIFRFVFCKKSSVEIDRKILAELAVNQPDAFKALGEKAQSAN